jgi:hypothetical protein
VSLVQEIHSSDLSWEPTIVLVSQSFEENSVIVQYSLSSHQAGKYIVGEY